MNTKIIRGAEVTRPSTTPLKSNILDHATVVTTNSFGLRNNEGLWPSYNCLDTLVPTALCPEPTIDKTFQTAGWVPSMEFAVYGGVQCSPVGLDVNDQKSEVARVFGLNEGKAVEQALLLNRFLATDSDADVQWDDPTDLTTAGPVPLQVALALLEGHAASIYAGVPTIHMPRAAASVLGDRIRWEGDKAFTLLGSKVAIGGGYDVEGPTVAWNLYATGEVFVEKSEEVNVHAWTLPGDRSSDHDLSDNTSIALAERMFRVGVDCFVAKASGLVPTPASGSGGGAGLIDNGDGTWSTP